MDVRRRTAADQPMKRSRGPRCRGAELHATHASGRPAKTRYLSCSPTGPGPGSGVRQQIIEEPLLAGAPNWQAPAAAVRERSLDPAQSTRRRPGASARRHRPGADGSRAAKLEMSGAMQRSIRLRRACPRARRWAAASPSRAALRWEKSPTAADGWAPMQGAGSRRRRRRDLPPEVAQERLSIGPHDSRHPRSNARPVAMGSRARPHRRQIGAPWTVSGLPPTATRAAVTRNQRLPLRRTARPMAGTVPGRRLWTGPRRNPGRHTASSCIAVPPAVAKDEGRAPLMGSSASRCVPAGPKPSIPRRNPPGPPPPGPRRRGVGAITFGPPQRHPTSDLGQIAVSRLRYVDVRPSPSNANMHSGTRTGRQAKVNSTKGAAPARLGSEVDRTRRFSAV